MKQFKRKQPEFDNALGRIEVLHKKIDRESRALGPNQHWFALSVSIMFFAAGLIVIYFQYTDPDEFQNQPPYFLFVISLIFFVLWCIWRRSLQKKWDKFIKPLEDEVIAVLNTTEGLFETDENGALIVE